MIYTYCTLKFDKETVLISFNTEADCNSKKIEKEYEKSSEKTHEWYRIKSEIHIKDFKEFEELSYADGKLTGKKVDSNKPGLVEFNEVP